MPPRCFPGDENTGHSTCPLTRLAIRFGEPFEEVLVLPGESAVLESVTLPAIRSEHLDGAVLLQIGPDVERERLECGLRQRICRDIVERGEASLRASPFRVCGRRAPRVGL